ncbi:sacsin N-terminal ATP-binding-like domain-containing protein [Actinocorallia sp. A-T 12471]|uniref:sacsin N-terminal ATP-binding-like domain-containing protein n=1 Tax=Actinocorallia sp. A-T 12471 TaxID=3089813 RepID=UPI0029CBC760|nr:hypothetical protein [Actinocorallia sp. A-T 12471]MDX6738381.1 hypothetical protein [Actinocorallia sp. A-T 12471]
MSDPASEPGGAAPSDPLDPFGTAAIRGRVLAAWTASPARFREDANAEEDLALGGYRDRVVIELAQNAADAAIRAGVPGELHLTLNAGVLTAANTGAPLTAEAVESLSTLRTSTKTHSDAVESAQAGERKETAGRFGVGFAAVVSVCDRPSIASATGAVAWSAEETLQLVQGVPELAGELGRRGNHVPVLRLPFASSAPPPGGHTTQVTLPLRDEAAEQAVRARLEEFGPELMLGLPALGMVTVTVDGRSRVLQASEADPGLVVIVETGGDGSAVTQWRTVERQGEVPPALLADRPTEERARPYWSVRWAVRAEPRGPLDGPPKGPGVLYAPTPSDEGLDLPALLIANFPLAPDRRHVQPGPFTDFLVARAAEAYADLVAGATGPEALDLVPGPVGSSALDGAVRAAVLDLLPDRPLLPLAEDGRARVRGRDAAVVDAPPAVVEALTGVVPGLLPKGWTAGHRALRALGVRRMGLADVADALAAVEREPAWWRGIYAALASADPGELGALPVPLTDGRLVRGPRGVLLGRDLPSPEHLEILGLRVVDPDAEHQLLLRLGAVEAGPRQVLSDPAVRAAVEGSLDAEDPEAVADAVLSLARGLITPGEPWLAELALPAQDGELYPAGELTFPDAPLRDVMGEDSPFGVVAAELIEEYGEDALAAVGVLRGFALLRVQDADPEDLDLDGVEDWDLPSGHIPELVAVRDLELVKDWEAALTLLSRPPYRDAIIEPVRFMDGRTAPSYTAWWLAEHEVLGGPRRAEDADPLLDGLYAPAPAGLDAGFARALGVRAALSDVPPDELLDRLADPALPVTRPQLRALWAWLAGTTDATPPTRVRALSGGVPEVVPAEDAIIVDVPYALPLLAGQPLILLPLDRAAALADLLDLAVASEEIPGELAADGEEREVPAHIRALFPESPETYVHHDTLVVDGHEVPWWYDGAPHAATPHGLARALAWEMGRWDDRLLLAALLVAPAETEALLTEADLA